MKATKICPKCPFAKIGRAKTILDSEHHDVHLGEGRDGPLWGLIGKKHKLSLEAYICTTCGYVETYVKNPEEIKWDVIKNFEWIDSPQEDNANSKEAESSEESDEVASESDAGSDSVEASPSEEEPAKE